jgi:hypothetical protein
MEPLVTFLVNAQPIDQLVKLFQRAERCVTDPYAAIGYVKRLNGDIEVWATKRAKRELYS